jgi:O-antigen/teichoic acid export membrane protein
MPRNMKRPSRRHAAIATLAGTGASTAITVAQAFVLIPLALGALGTPLYGAWLAASELLVFVQSLDLGIPNLLTQRIGAALGRRDHVAAAKWASTGLVLTTLLAAGLSAAAVVVAPAIAGWAQVDDTAADSFIMAFRVAAVGSSLLLIYNAVLSIARGTQRVVIVNVGQVAGAISGLVTAVVLLQLHFGIWALALGLVVRALVCAVAAGLFLVRAIAGGLLIPETPSRMIVREIVTLLPPLAGASAAYLLANNTEVVLVATLFGPAAAAVYGLTKRAADGIRNLLDAIAWAVYGGFAHLVTAEDRHRARVVLRDILWFRLGIASVAGTILVAVNEPFVRLLFGAEHFGGFWLTAGFALQMIVAGQAFLANYLYRAAGGVTHGSYLLMADAVARVVAMTGGLVLAGLAGAPFAAIAVSAVSLAVVTRRLEAALPAHAILVPRVSAVRRAVPLTLFGCGLAVGAVGVPASWPAVGAVVGSLAGVGALSIWVLLPPGSYGRSFLQWNRASTSPP